MPALRKVNAELLLGKGIEQKVPDAIIPDESLARAENVEFSKVGIARKRQGFVENSNLILGAGALDEVRRLGVRQRRELLCVSETVTQIGSAAGAGNAGDTLFSYSEEAERWIVRGKMPRPNVDVLWTSGIPAAGNIGQQQQYVTGGIGNYVCVAYQADFYNTVRVVIFDVGGDVNGALREAPTIVIDTTFQTTGSELVGWVTAGGKVWLVHSTGASTGTSLGTDFSAARAFRPDVVKFDNFDTNIKSSMSCYSVSTDGANIYAAIRYGTGGYEVLCFDADLSLVNSVQQNGVVANAQEVAIDARLGHVDLVRLNLADGKVYVSRLDKVTLTQRVTNQYVTTGSFSAALAGSNLTICTVNDYSAVILWANQGGDTITTRPTYLAVGLIDMNRGALLGYFDHMALVPYAPPFIIDGRVYFIAMHSSGIVRPNASATDTSGTQPGEESFMCFQIPLDNMSPYNVPFPCAQWDFFGSMAKLSFFGSAIGGTYWMNGRSIYQDGTGVYVLSNIATAAGQAGSQWLPSPRLVRLEFGDATHRWRHEEFHDVAAFAGGVPFVYDGTRAYELAASLHQPVPLAWGIANGGSLPADKLVFVRTAMLYVDGNGRECWGQPSRIVSFTPTGVQLSGYVYVMPVTTTMKPDMGNQFLGRMKLCLFVATEDAPNEFIASGTPIEIDPFQLDEENFVITSLPPASNSQMYTSGFELDNFPPPPTRTMVVHSGRLFCIASDSNEVFYTKPFRRERGPEFAVGQQIPLPDKGTALASLNDRLAIFTHRSILAIGGDGPDVTGTPPDAFSRPVLVTPDYGCIEYCAVGRTPLGVIFRGQQGFYLLTMGFDVQYIGGSVEDITAAWVSTRSIVHDQKAGCCRITGFTGDRSEELCFWYDTKRWSLNVLASDVVDSVTLVDNLVVAVTDPTVAVASRYRLGSRDAAPATQDFGEDYEQVIETGWVSFDHAGQFKRVWSMYALVRNRGSDATIRFQVWKDWEERVSSDREFLLSAPDVDAHNLRIHLKHQKLKSIKVRVTVTGSGAGVDVMKLGFELGIRTGGPKEAREQTQ